MTDLVRPTNREFIEALMKHNKMYDENGVEYIFVHSGSPFRMKSVDQDFPVAIVNTWDSINKHTFTLTRSNRFKHLQPVWGWDENKLCRRLCIWDVNNDKTFDIGWHNYVAYEGEMYDWIVELQNEVAKGDK